ncbi:MAG TPA: NADH-quinone oxidoreductase subunit C [Candidatus Micrarchaeia archaeon]|nr:NADH-quinone oxidoreductase subunit C [Candidatus Micrarchaeia archaeon]
MPATVRPAGTTALACLRSGLPDAARAVSEDHDQLTIELEPTRLIDAVRLLRDDPVARFEMPIFMTCVDWPERDPRFDVVYVLRSLTGNDVVRLLVRADADGTVPTLSGLLPGMEWHERECYDLFGLTFEGHPNLRRILLPDDWEGHPLRRDYVSFGEPVAFTHNLEWALSPQDRPEYMPGSVRGSVERP